jgi:hypothetical protein
VPWPRPGSEATTFSTEDGQSRREGAVVELGILEFGGFSGVSGLDYYSGFWIIRGLSIKATDTEARVS